MIHTAFLRHCLSVAVLGLCVYTAVAQKPDRFIDSFLEKRHHFSTVEDVEGNYTIDLTVDAMINYETQTGDTTYLAAIDRFFALRRYNFAEQIPYQKIPFCDVYFSYFQLKRDSAFIKPFIAESYRMMKEIARSPEGAICINHKGENRMLIDYLQNYISRMAKAGSLSGDTTFFDETTRQIRLYRSILQYSNSKLYSQGRGWLVDKSEISPSAWSRGQGWMMRGLVSALEFLPPNSHYSTEVSEYLKELSVGLLKRQDEDGMWHTLPLLGNKESAPEVSGTAMIAYYMSVALHKGFIEGRHFKTAVQKSIRGVHNYTGGDCIVRNVSKGPGPLVSIDDYRQMGECDNLHGLQAIINLQTIEH
ncbi:MAG: glycoside hydrolase family 88 protein [Bacteroidales bacterium]|nr:glycoside hydrolase family 88 protein [Bacteroidales bacterium]